jgi:hypothetical protein
MVWFFYKADYRSKKAIADAKSTYYKNFTSFRFGNIRSNTAICIYANCFAFNGILEHAACLPKLLFIWNSPAI